MFIILIFLKIDSELNFNFFEVNYFNDRYKLFILYLCICTLEDVV